ncbi:MAG: DUF2171 domain-containing protein [Solirubrobacterales bacterium]|nr:DUF2171 domain-containing protein [Solirubrobacterales bacterium]
MDPASWLQIKPGWRVLAADGSAIGAVDEVAGDERRDIFDGLSISTSGMGQPRYVRAEQVGGIEVGVVHLRLSREEAQGLGPFLEPASSLEIEPDNRTSAASRVAADARHLAGSIVEPTQRRDRPLNIWTRIAHYLRRMRGG